MSKNNASLALLLAGFVLVMLLAAGSCREASRVVSVPVRPRQPVALVVADQGDRLFVANRCAGTVCVIDVPRREMIAEVEVAKRLAYLADSGDGGLLALDEAAGELLVLKRDKDSLSVSARHQVGDAAVSVCRVAPSRVAVACLWPRQLVIVDLSPRTKQPVYKKISLPFAPRCQLAVEGGAKIVVADGFWGTTGCGRRRAGRCRFRAIRTGTQYPRLGPQR